jgi:hypothetical protein
MLVVSLPWLVIGTLLCCVLGGMFDLSGGLDASLFGYLERGGGVTLRRIVSFLTPRSLVK